jgi:hypothetical protein
MAFLAAASQRGLPLVVLSPMAYWVFDEALEVRQVSHRHRLDCRRRTTAQMAARVSLSLPLRSTAPSKDSPAKHRAQQKQRPPPL